ncbi:glutathione S-transferase A4 isoform X1 [Vulpes vulpes]|uniref:glutathione transferase n=1 Tax=Vulpes vulpes TaxID=9627 RepID=A0ABM4YIA6_VULVU
MVKSASLSEVEFICHQGASHCPQGSDPTVPFHLVGHLEGFLGTGKRSVLTPALPFSGNHLLFQQVPMVEIDGMKLVQTRSILHYIADKHHLFGRDLKERTLIDMYVEGTLDLLELIIMHPFLKPDDQQKEVVNMAQKAIIRYFPVFEKVLRDHGQRFLVGNQLSLADIILLQTILALEEKIPNILSAFPHLQEFTVKISNIPTIKKFLEPGSKKKPPPDDIYVRTVYNIFMP